MPDTRPTGPKPYGLGLDNLLRVRRDQLGFYAELQKRHGDIVPIRLGPYLVWLILDPEAAEGITAKEADSFIRFPKIMNVLRQWNGPSLLIEEGEAWRTRRRQTLPAFASRRLPSYAERIVLQTAKMVERWMSRREGDHVTLDTDQEMAALSLFIAGDTLFGVDMQRSAPEVGRATTILSEVAFREITAPLTPPLWWPSAYNRRKRWAMATVDRIVREIIEPRIEDDHDAGDLLSMLIEHCAKDLEKVRNESLTLLIAGHETTGATLSWACHLLCANDNVLSDVLDEVDGALGGRTPSEADMEALPLLRAVAMETLRLYPPSYILLPRQASRPASVGRLDVRRGEIAQVVPFLMQRDPRWFPDPNSFDPSRFMKPPTWPRYAYLPFGAGPRVCIGQNFAMLELVLILAVLLQKFRPSPDASQAVPDPKFSLRPQGGLIQKWMSREG